MTNLFCPKCKKVLSVVMIYSKNSKRFLVAWNWMECKNCKGFVLTANAKGYKRTELAPENKGEKQ